MGTAIGEYIARMDSDDISLPRRIRKQVEYLEDNKDVDIVGTNIVIFYPDGGERVPALPKDHEILKYQSLLYCPIYHPTIMFRKKIIHKIVYRTPLLEDYDLWLRLLHEDPDGPKFGNLGEVLLRLRKHPKNRSGMRDEHTT